MESTDNQAQRSIKDGPFSWQSKVLLRRIVDACDSRTDQAHVLAVYLALTWIASDKQSESFTESKSRIAARSGMSTRKADDVLSFLAGLGVVSSKNNVIEGSRELGPNTYTLRAICPTSGTVCLTRGTDPKTTPCRDIEESFEQVLKNHSEDAPTGATRRISKKPSKPVQTTEELIADLCTDPAYAGIDVRTEHAKAMRWASMNHRQCKPRFFINWLNRVEKPMTGTGTVARNPAPLALEPENWRATLKQILPGSDYDGAWVTLADSVKQKIKSSLP